VTTEIVVKGMADLSKFLETLPQKLAANVVRGSLRAGAKVIEAQAKANAPVGPPNEENVRLYGGYQGALRDSIRVGVRIKGDRVTASIKAGGKRSKGADVFYAHMVEFGTKAHILRGKFAGSWHPGTAPRPFMRPALDSQATAAVIAAAEYMKKRLATKEGIDTKDIVIEAEE